VTSEKLEGQHTIRPRDVDLQVGFVVSGKSRGILSTSFVAALFLRKKAIKTPPTTTMRTGCLMGRFSRSSSNAGS